MAYSLKGVISHKGERITTGHYLSYVKHESQWYRFDDAIVKEKTFSDVQLECGRDCYILVYVLNTDI